MLRITCVMVRNQAERPITITEAIIGWSHQPRWIMSVTEEVMNDKRNTLRPEKWDGTPAERIADVIASL